MTATELAEEAARNPYGNVTGEVRRRAADVQRRANEAFEQSDHYVHENPWPVILGAAAVGLLAGMALSQRREATLRERFLDEPMDQAREVLFSLLAPVAKRLQNQYGNLRAAVEDATGRVHDVDGRGLAQPMAKQADRLAKFLRFW